MSFSVQGKSAIVTGGGSGIGLSFVKLLLESKCNVLIADLALRPEAQILVDGFQSKGHGSPRAVFQRTDVVDWPQLERMFEVALQAFGQVDIVCPGAGVFEPHWSNFWRPPGSPESKDSPDGGRYALLDINLTHPIRTTQLAISHFLRNNPSQSPKHIIHISSIAGQLPALGPPVYVATKHAISGFVRSLAKLDSKCGIRVTAVAPGLIKTPLWTEHPEKLKMFDDYEDEWVTPERVAEVMLALIQQDEIVETAENREGERRVQPVTGGTIMEISTKVRAVNAINDPGPPSKAGSVASKEKLIEDEVFGLLSRL